MKRDWVAFLIALFVIATFLDVLKLNYLEFFGMLHVLFYMLFGMYKLWLAAYKHLSTEKGYLNERG